LTNTSPGSTGTYASSYFNCYSFIEKSKSGEAEKKAEEEEPMASPHEALVMQEEEVEVPFSQDMPEDTQKDFVASGTTQGTVS
jgi:hypothetical protein